MKNILLLSALFSVLLFSVKGQEVSYKKRIEIQLEDGYSREKIYPFGKTGFVIRSIRDVKSGGESQWKYELYNTDLKSTKTKSVTLHKKLYPNETVTNKERIHTLFTDRKGNFSIVTVTAATLEIDKVDGFMPKKSWVKDMAVLGDYAYFSSSIKGMPYLFSVNWKTGKQKQIQAGIRGFKPKQIILESFLLLKKSDEIMLDVSVKIDKHKRDTYIIQLDKEGNKKNVYNLTEKVSNNFNSISVSKVDENEFIFTGTYNTDTRTSSQGIFFCKTKNNAIEQIAFHRFTDLENFFSFLPKERQEKIEKKQKKKDKKGKELRLNYSLFVHDIIKKEDGYMMLGEAYYPTYRTESYQVMSGSRMTTQFRTVFDGYQYTHAILAKFGEKGKLQWSSSFEMWASEKPYSAKKLISIKEEKTATKMLFTSYGKIISKVIDDNGKTIKEEKSVKIKATNAGDNPKWTVSSSVDYWYDNVFLVSGKQKIKNQKGKNVENKNQKGKKLGGGNVKRKRKIFFISKVQFE